MPEMIRRTPAAVGWAVRRRSGYARAHGGGAPGGGKYPGGYGRAIGGVPVEASHGTPVGGGGAPAGVAAGGTGPGGEGGPDADAGGGAVGAAARVAPHSLQNFAPSTVSRPHEGHADNPAPSRRACARPGISVARTEASSTAPGCGGRMPFALLFDLDGTLFDTFDILVEAQNGALAEFGEPPVDEMDLRPLIGIPLARQMEILRGMTGPKVAAVNESYYRRFVALVEKGVPLYPGVRETLAALPGRKMGTMTTRRQKVADLMLRVAGIREHFTRVVGGDEVSRPKPEPDLPRHAAKALGVPPEECIVVGDSPVDILAGRAAGARTVAATYGYGRLDELRGAHPDAEIARFADLPAAIEILERARGSRA